MEHVSARSAELEILPGFSLREISRVMNRLFVKVSISGLPTDQSELRTGPEPLYE